MPEMRPSGGLGEAGGGTWGRETRGPALAITSLRGLAAEAYGGALCAVRFPGISYVRCWTSR